MKIDITLEDLDGTTARFNPPSYNIKDGFVIFQDNGKVLKWPINRVYRIVEEHTAKDENKL